MSLSERLDNHQRSIDIIILQYCHLCVKFIELRAHRLNLSRNHIIQSCRKLPHNGFEIRLKVEIDTPGHIPDGIYFE